MRFLLYFHVYTYLSRQLFVIHLLLAIACVVSAGIMADKAKDLDDYGFYKLFFTRWNELIAALVSETPWLEEGRGVTLLVTLCAYHMCGGCILLPHTLLLLYECTDQRQGQGPTSRQTGSCVQN